MAIVAWQPGPNRMLAVPTEEELAALRPGEVVHREPPAPAPGSMGGQRSYGQQALGKGLSSGGGGVPEEPPPPTAPAQGQQGGVWETLRLDEEGRPLLQRHDVWGREERAGPRFGP